MDAWHSKQLKTPSRRFFSKVGPAKTGAIMIFTPELGRSLFKYYGMIPL